MSAKNEQLKNWINGYVNRLLLKQKLCHFNLKLMCKNKTITVTLLPERNICYSSQRAKRVFQWIRQSCLWLRKFPWILLWSTVRCPNKQRNRSFQLKRSVPIKLSVNAFDYNRWTFCMISLFQHSKMYSESFSNTYHPQYRYYSSALFYLFIIINFYVNILFINLAIKCLFYNS